MAIFIISRRPAHPHNERAWSYINRFTGDNAEVSGSPARSQPAMYAALRRRADSMAHSWRVAEPDSQFRVMDSGMHNPSDKFKQPTDAPIVPGDEDGPVGVPVVDKARAIIAKAEHDLGPLTSGERRDLLADNTKWGRDVIKSVVAEIEADSAPQGDAWSGGFAANH